MDSRTKGRGLAPKRLAFRALFGVTCGGQSAGWNRDQDAQVVAGDSLKVESRPIAEGVVPLISVEGTGAECGRQYAEVVLERYPGYRRYLDLLTEWLSLSAQVERLFEQRAPYLLDMHRAMLAVAGPPKSAPEPARPERCTSFGVAGSVTLDGEPISGQSKDTARESAALYIVLRMRLTDGPTLLVLAYPGEVLGYGFWSTGMSVFRNSLFSSAGGRHGLTMVQWGLLALAGKSVHDGVELARTHGIADCGNVLLSDGQGESVSVEFNAGGVSIVPAREGIATHANHPLGKETQPFEKFASDLDREDSRYRMERRWQLLDAERGRLTAQKALMALSDHSRYPYGLCRHLAHGRNFCTTSVVIAEPTAGKLHVTRGNACMNWPVTYGA